MKSIKFFILSIVFSLEVLLLAAHFQERKFRRLDRELEVSMKRLDRIVSGLFADYDASDPVQQEKLFVEWCYDGTYDEIDTLCFQQWDMLLEMADCCPSRSKRYLLMRSEAYCSLRQLADAAEAPYLYTTLFKLRGSAR